MLEFVKLKRTIRLIKLIHTSINNNGGVLSAAVKFVNIVIRQGLRGVFCRILFLNKKSYTILDRNKIDIKNYQEYILFYEPSYADLRQLLIASESLYYKPCFSIIISVCNADSKWLTRSITSVLNQVYPYWDLYIVDDCSSFPNVRLALEKFSAQDQRIRLVFSQTNGRMADTNNSALGLTTSEFICLMGSQDEIAPHALYEFAVKLNQYPTLDMIYSDEDKLDIEGNRFDPFYKPDWSPEMLESFMYTANFACYRMSLVRKISGFRDAFNVSHDYDFVLKFTELTNKIGHVAKVLYHCRVIPASSVEKSQSREHDISALRALSGRAERLSGGGEAKCGDYPGCFDLRYKIQGTPLISIIIPSAGRTTKIGGEDVDLLVQAVRSITEKTSYKNFEIIIIDNDDLLQSTIDALSIYECRYVHFSNEFNIASKMNLGVRVAKGDFLLFMNDDIKIINDDWLGCMLQLCQREGVGVVGAKLHYEDETLQHVGVAFWNGLPDHIHRTYAGNYPGYFFSAVANRNYLAVTGAVLMTKRCIFEKVGGFDEKFAINYNDIDYCLKVIKKGFRVVFAAGAKLHHYESLSRDAVVTNQEIELFQQRWGDFVADDPYYSNFFDAHPPNFNLKNFQRRASLSA